VDGKVLAKALAQDLIDAGVFERVSLVDDPAGLQDQTVVIRGRVLQSELRILKDGTREYALGVMLSAFRGPEGQPPFWLWTARRKARAEGDAAAYEIGALVRALDAEAVSGLGDVLNKKVAP
jgi:hypothetical protein